jgi:hypothetical protein
MSAAGDVSADHGALMARVARGDERAFAEVYDQLAPMLYGIVLRIVRDPAQAEEVTQEAFVELWRQSARFDRLAMGYLAGPSRSPVGVQLTACVRNSRDATASSATR